MRYATLSAALTTIALASTASAHHSNAPHYDRDRPITVQGVVEEFEFVNPHAFLHIRAQNEVGESVVWACEMQTANMLARRGWTGDEFVAGQAVTVQAIAARRDPLGCSLNSAELADGTTLARSGAIERPDSAVADEGERAAAAVSERAATLGDGIPNLAGPWVRDRSRRQRGVGPGAQRPGAERLTPAGLAASEGYDDRFDDPSFECSASSISRAWSEPGTPTDIEQYDDRVVIHHEYMDTVRAIRLTRERETGLVPRLYGHSIGWYEGSTLVIDTVGFGAGVLTPHPGILHGDSLHMVERITVNPEELGMTVEWTAEDPEFFKEPFSGTSYYTPAPYPVTEYDCTPERANR